MTRKTACAGLSVLLALVLCGQLVAQQRGFAVPARGGRGSRQARGLQDAGVSAPVSLLVRGTRFDCHELAGMARLGMELIIDVARVSLDREDLSRIVVAGPTTLWVTDRRLGVEDLQALVAKGARVRVDAGAVPLDRYDILSIARSGHLTVYGAESRFSHEELAAFAAAGVRLRLDAGASRLDVTELARIADAARQPRGSPGATDR